MPQRYQVPTLKILAIRIIARPDGVNRSRDERFPNAESKRREQNILKFFKRKGAAVFLGSSKHVDHDVDDNYYSYPHRRRNIIITDNILTNNSDDEDDADEPSTKKSGRMMKNGNPFENEDQSIAERIINTWIRLSTFYKTRLDEIRLMQHFLTTSRSAIHTLDFLYEGFWMRDGSDVTQFGGLLPYTLEPLKIDAFTWLEIVHILETTGCDKYVRNLSIYFGNANPRTALMTDATVYKFTKSMAGFKHLIKLVVHGDATDKLMKALGTHCLQLKYLDIRDTQVTEMGILQLLFKETGESRRLRSTEMRYTFPEGVLNPCTSTLKYLDMSTVPYKGLLMKRNRAVVAVCDYLVQTPRRFFFHPLGRTRMFCQIDLLFSDFRNKVMTSLRTELVSLFLEISRSFWPCLHQGYTHVESRVNSKGEEVSFNFYNIDYLVIHMRLENMTIVDIFCYSATTCDFLPIDIIQDLLPNVERLKASLKGIIVADGPQQCLVHLKTVTMPLAHSTSTLISILRHCENLQYIEVREIFKASSAAIGGDDMLNDGDVHEMTCLGCPSLEVLRLPFETKISLLGVKNFTQNCPKLRVIGDLKKWDIALSALEVDSAYMDPNLFVNVKRVQLRHVQIRNN